MKTKVQATRDFVCAGRTVIQEGAIREVEIDGNGSFWTQTDVDPIRKRASAFGTCHISNGWKKVK